MADIRRYTLVLIASAVAVPVAAALNTNYFLGVPISIGSSANVVEDGRTAGIVQPTRLTGDRLEDGSGRFETLRAALGLGEVELPVISGTNDRRFPQLPTSLRCQRNPDAVGCTLASPTVR